MVGLVQANKVSEAVALRDAEVASSFSQLRSHYDVLGEAVKNKADALTASMSDDAAFYQTFLAVATVFTLLICVGSMVYGPRLITDRLDNLIVVMRDISQGVVIYAVVWTPKVRMNWLRSPGRLICLCKTCSN
ncbi:hypothetical protein KUL156_54370 [Alteromonas sp. KUL156]|nr:hypothetical protein KUL154_24940 [Alteromonas sp. KUL154]GFE02845.1 hypothetical protein KUL156_54370 [Alteromonas sp. KUL156]